jgi:4'-phosphopantetheinyl transferase
MTKAPAVYWLSETGDDIAGDGQWLTGRERGKLKQLRFTKRRADWRLGRWTAKRAVCAYLRGEGKVLGLEDVEIVAAEDGAPELYVGGAASRITISISHSGNVGFAVLSPRGLAVGCDVEAVEPRSERFVRDYFTAEELKRVHGSDDSDRPHIINLMWSAKESTLKAVRTGLERDTRGVEVVLPVRGIDPVDQWAPFTVSCVQSQRQFYGWWKRDGKLVFTVSCSEETEPPSPLIGGTRP